MPVWEPEVVVDEALARRLLEQFPALHVESLAEVAAGWDNSVWLVNAEWAFRFPRRRIAIPGVEREIALLPRLAPLLPLPIPNPVFVGRAAHGFPWPFFGTRYLDGAEPTDVQDGARRDAARELGAFLRLLHGLELDADLPIDFNRRTDMTVRVPLARNQLSELDRLRLWTRSPLVDELLDEAERLRPPSAGTVLVHGDLHFRHLVVDRNGRLSGVIDWGDICRADRSADLLLYWSFLPPEARPAFLETYGEVSDEQLLRARVLALSVNSALAAFAHAEGLPAVAQEAVAGLVRSAT